MKNINLRIVSNLYNNNKHDTTESVKGDKKQRKIIKMSNIIGKKFINED